MDITVLRKAGLSDSQAKGYLALVEHGALTPAELADKTNESRTNAYAIADKLVEIGLASKVHGSRNAYAPESPSKLRALLIRKQRDLKAASDELNGILPILMSTYRLVTDKPGVLHLEGIDSLRLVYDDVIKTGDTLRILPSAEDRNDPKVAEMIDKQIARQRAAGIKTEVLLRETVFLEYKTQHDKLFEVRKSKLDALDTQIMIYGNNVAMTTFKNGVVTTILTSAHVAATFRQIFEALWRQ